MNNKHLRISVLAMISLLISGCTFPDVGPSGGLPTRPRTSVPTSEPTSEPTSAPTTSAPTTSVPTYIPTSDSTSDSTSEPTMASTSDPTSAITSDPTTSIPTSESTSIPTSDSTSEPTTSAPTSTSTSIPTSESTSAPTSIPTSESTSTPTSASTSSSGDIDEYYVSISDSLSGNSLLKALNSLNNTKKVKSFKYADHKVYQQYLEIDPQGTIPSGKMLGFYDNAIVSGPWDNQATWNREHVWPNSRGGSSVEGDLHMVRPTSVKINSERGNDVYGKISGTYDPGQYVAEYRGIAARIIFYCAIANTSLVINEETGNSGNNMGILSTLLEWNLQYLPEDQNSSSLALRVEWHRNETIQKDSRLQGNRNPFIDHPEYACKIWGNTNSATKSVCGM